MGAELHPGFDPGFVALIYIGADVLVIVVCLLFVRVFPSHLCFRQRFFRHSLGLHGEVDGFGKGFQCGFRPVMVIFQCGEGQHIVSPVRDHECMMVEVISLLQNDQHVHAVRRCIRPFLIASLRADRGINLAEAVLPGAGEGHDFLIRPDRILACQGHASLHGEGAVRVIPHSAKIGFRLNAGAEYALNPQRLAGCRFIRVNVHFPQQVQMVLGTDFVQFVLHFPCVQVVGVVIIPEVLGKGFFGMVNGHIRVVGLQPFVPFLGGLIARRSLHPLQGQQGSVPDVAFKSLLRLLSKGHILKPQHIHDRAPHQQQRKGDHRRNEPQFSFGQSANLPLPLPEFPGADNEFVPHVVESRHQIHCVHTYPSSLSRLRSLFRVRWSMDVTLL